MKKLGRSVIYTSLATDAKKPAARGSMGFEAFEPGGVGLGLNPAQSISASKSVVPTSSPAWVSSVVA